MLENLENCFPNYIDAVITEGLAPKNVMIEALLLSTLIRIKVKIQETEVVPFVVLL
ncbi:hypothetical protein Plhal304r1_c040g0118461 [Plasmopara halstedii]